MDATLKAMLNEAAVVAKRYAYKCRWADVADLTQEAQLAVCEAYARYDGQRSATAYAGMIADYAIRAWLTNNVSPVKVPHRKAEAAKAIKRGDADDLAVIAATDEQADAVLEREEQMALTTQRVAELLSSGQEARLGALVLMGQKSSEVANENGMPVKDVYVLTRKLVRQLKSDATLLDAWQSL
jgi:RNA polymerase sigma factor (sigma-70 family)